MIVKTKLHILKIHCPKTLDGSLTVTNKARKRQVNFTVREFQDIQTFFNLGRTTLYPQQIQKLKLSQLLHNHNGKNLLVTPENGKKSGDTCNRVMGKCYMTGPIGWVSGRNISQVEGVVYFYLSSAIENQHSEGKYDCLMKVGSKMPDKGLYSSSKGLNSSLFRINAFVTAYLRTFPLIFLSFIVYYH